MQISEYEVLDGLAMAELVRAREVSPEDLMKCAIDLARKLDPVFHMLTYARYDESIALAKEWQVQGTFGGIPFLLKDSGIASKRFPSSYGSRLFNDTAYDFNATVVDRFEQAGLIAFARTSVPELCMSASTEALRNGGATINPWDATRSVGGSSGGAAVAVATGIVPIAHGSDGGGSIRIPAACCGVFGLKPSRGRVPMGPNRGEGWGGMVSDGVLSRTVRDTAAAMDAICGYEPGAPYAAPPKTGKYLDVVSERTSKKLRIAVWREAWNGIAIAPECQAAIEKTAALCRELGHEVIEAKPPEIDFDGFVRAHGIVLATNIVLAVDLRLKTLGRTLQEEDLESVIRDGYSIGKSLAATDYVDSISRFHAIGRALTKFMASYDLVLTPTLAQLPAKLQHLAMSYGGFWAFREKTSHYSTYLPIINASGQPAASIPLYSTETGVPVASQLIGHFGREDVVLDLAAQLERIAPWKDRKPLLNI